MNNQKFFFLISVLFTFEITVSQNVSPKDFLDEALKQVDNLKSTVQGSIFSSFSEFSIMYMDILNHGDKLYKSGSISIDQVHDEVTLELNQLKELAAAANKDISRCTSGREQMVHKLPDELKERILTCKNNQELEADAIVDESKYIVDITMTRVNLFEFQLQICGDSILCLSPVLEEVEKSLILLPQEHQVEVNRARELLVEVKVIIQECSDNNVADFTGYVTDLVEQIGVCASGILGRA